MRPTLHVAALPFPSGQGTQAAIRFMVEALEGSARLVTYAHGDGDAHGIHHLRARAWMQDRSLRSGPSVAKAVNDLALARAVREAARPGELLVAHHVEAAIVCRLLRRPFVFVAHTDLEPELGTYLPAVPPRLTAGLGRAIDVAACRRAAVLCAVSPMLATQMAERTDRAVHPLPVPWPVPRAIGEAERQDARRRFGLPAEARVALYAGNLDAYQGLELAISALATVRARDARWRGLAATASEGPIPAGFARAPLRNEDDRRAAHAAADVVVVPRKAPGGVPVKLLDALARGVPVASVPRALAGHTVTALELAERNDDSAALAEAIQRALDLSPTARSERIERARAYVAEHHSRAAFVRAFERAIASDSR